MSSITEELTTSHQRQRSMVDLLIEAPTPEEKRASYHSLKIELKAHAAAEERHFYMPLMELDSALDLSRHAIHEHHLMDEMMEDLDELDPDSKEWDKVAKDLHHRVHHHLDEEEQDYFPKAKELMSKTKAAELGKGYNEEFEEFQAKHAQEQINEAS